MPTPESIPKLLKAQADAYATWRTTQLTKWQRNVEYRQNKVLDAEPDRDEVLVPVDWSRTRNKIAQLYIQVPHISLFPRAPQWRSFTPLVSAALNFQLSDVMHAEQPVEEVLGDAINAAGIGIALVSYEAEFDDDTVPSANLAMRKVHELVDYVKSLAGQPVPTNVVKKPLYQKTTLTSIDPADFLAPLGFSKINWNTAPWLGYDFRLTDAEARRKGWLSEGERAGSDTVQSVNAQYEQTVQRDQSKMVSCRRIFYRPYLFDPAERDCRKIKVLTWINDKDEPVEDEDFKWQKYSPDTKEWVGMTTYPLKPLTLTHISGQAIPPSDSEIGRPQVRELNRSRTQMIQQRDRSNPLRWYDVNLVDEEIIEQIRRGTWQDMIPTQGPGSNVIGEVARASYPRESYEFQNVFNQDLDQAWSSGPNQGGYQADGSTSATEAQITQQNFSVGLEHQRAKVLAWFLEIGESVLDLMQMFFELEAYAPLGPIGADQKLAAWDKDKIPGKYVFSARPDAAIRLDASFKRASALNVYKLLRNDPLINGQKLIGDVLEAHDIDPSEAFAPPKPPEDPKPKPAAFSFNGADMGNAIAVALIQKSTPITPQELQAARLLMADAGIPVAPVTIVPDTQHVDTGAAPPPTGAPSDANNPGLPKEVNPINRRYAQGGGDGGMDQGMIGEGTGKV